MLGSYQWTLARFGALELHPWKVKIKGRVAAP